MEITGLCETMFRPDSRSKREHSVRKFSNTYPSRFRQISTIFRYARYFSDILVNSREFDDGRERSIDAVKSVFTGTLSQRCAGSPVRAPTL